MFRQAGVAVVACGIAAASLQGCGSGNDAGMATTTTVPTAPTTTRAGPVEPQDQKDFLPLKGVIYNAMPPNDQSLMASDMMQVGYSPLWGPDGRDDLGLLSSMGASTVSVQGLGSEPLTDHGEFLDRAEKLGLNVIVEFETTLGCSEDFDCYEAWKNATQKALTNQNFKKGDKWHPAVKSVLLMDQLSFNNVPVAGVKGAGPPQIPSGSEASCRTKAAMSALKGFLAGEKAASVDGQDVTVGVAWTSQPATTLDGVDGEETYLYGFVDMEKALQSGLTGSMPYASTAEMQDAFNSRWVNIMQASSEWGTFITKVHDTEKYTKGLLNEYEQRQLKSNWYLRLAAGPSYDGDSTFVEDLRNIQQEASKDSSKFMGVVLDSFLSPQDAPDDASRRFFKLGDSSSDSTEKACFKSSFAMEDPDIEEDCTVYPINCLTLDRLPTAVATAWGTGTLATRGLCPAAEVEEVAAFV